MGRKNNRRTTPRRSPMGRGAEADEDFTDTASEISDDTVAALGFNLAASGIDSLNSDPTPELKAKLAEQLEFLSERRAATRIDALQKVVALLKMLPSEVVEPYRATALDGTLTLFRKASEREAVLALRNLCVVFVHYGPEQERVVTRVFPVLKRMVTREEKGSPKRVWALHALGMAVFVCAEEKSRLEAVMRLCIDVLTNKVEGEEPTEDLEVAALENWTLLATLETQPYGSRKAYAWHLQLFLDKLNAAHPDVRAAAGEALALLEEQWRRYPHLDTNSKLLRVAAAAGASGADLFYDTESVQRSAEAKEEEDRHQQFVAALKIAEEARQKAREDAAANGGEAGAAEGDEDPEDEGLLVVPDVEGLLGNQGVPSATAETEAVPASTQIEDDNPIAVENDNEDDIVNGTEDEPEDTAEDNSPPVDTLRSGQAPVGPSRNADQIMSEVLERLQELSTQSSKSMSRKARKFERRAFREIQRSIQDHEAPVETLSFPNGDLVVPDYSGILQLAAMRRVLRSGLQRQLATNPFLQALFLVDEDIVHAQGGDDRMDALDKRLLVSKSSARAKERTHSRTNDRRARQNQKDFALAQGEF